MEGKYFKQFILILICLSKTLSCPSKQPSPPPPPTTLPTSTLAPCPRCGQNSDGYFEITGNGLVKVGEDVILTLCVSEKDIDRDCRFSSTQHESCFYLDNHKSV